MRGDSSVEYRVTYKRPAWASHTSKKYSRRSSMLKFVTSLDRAGYLIRVDQRRTEEWRPVKLTIERWEG
jgi:hypothetical protein